MILFLLLWCVCVEGLLCVGAANIFGFFCGWVGVLQLVFLLLYSPCSLCLEMGVPALEGGGGRSRKVLGQAFRVTQGPCVLGRNDGEPRLGKGSRASGRS